MYALYECISVYTAEGLSCSLWYVCRSVCGISRTKKLSPLAAAAISVCKEARLFANGAIGKVYDN